MEHLNQMIRVAIDENNPSVARIEEKCIKCGQCARVCNDFVSVNNNYDLASTCGKSICVNCGQCIKVCPTSSLVVKQEYKTIKKIIENSISSIIECKFLEMLNSEKHFYNFTKQIIRNHYICHPFNIYTL